MSVAYLPDITIRSVSDSDGEKLAAMVCAVYLEYPGCRVDEESELPGLLAPAKTARDWEGRWWVAERDREIIGSVALMPNERDAELKKLYVTRTARGAGLGNRLVRLAETEALARKAGKIVLWTDIRFHEAHRLYERMGYTRLAGTRSIPDASNTVEYCYTKDLDR